MLAGQRDPEVRVSGVDPGQADLAAADPRPGIGQRRVDRGGERLILLRRSAARPRPRSCRCGAGPRCRRSASCRARHARSRRRRRRSRRRPAVRRRRSTAATWPSASWLVRSGTAPVAADWSQLAGSAGTGAAPATPVVRIAPAAPVPAAAVPAARGPGRRGRGLIGIGGRTGGLKNDHDGEHDQDRDEDRPPSVSATKETGWPSRPPRGVGAAIWIDPRRPDRRIGCHRGAADARGRPRPRAGRGSSRAAVSAVGRARMRRRSAAAHSTVASRVNRLATAAVRPSTVPAVLAGQRR